MKEPDEQVLARLRRHARRRQERGRDPSRRGRLATDTNGRRYIDATAALWFCNVGYGRARDRRGGRRAADRLQAYSSFGAYTTEPTVEVAERLAALAPIPNAVVFLGSGGSDAVDTAAKLARRYWDVVGKPEKRIIVSREHGYHGMHGWARRSSASGRCRPATAASRSSTRSCASPDDGRRGRRRAVRRARRDEIAAFVGEPVIGAGGVIPPTEDYWREISALCREHDVLLVADEVITGFGRTGQMWGIQRYGIEPDMITFAKGVTSGYMPLGGVLVGERVRAPFWDEPIAGAVFRHGYTYSGPLGGGRRGDGEPRHHRARAAGRARRHAGAGPRQGGPPARGRAAGRRDPDRRADRRGRAQARRPRGGPGYAGQGRRGGAPTTASRAASCARHAIHISPPFVITEAQIDAMVDGIGNALEDVAPR